MCRSVRSSEELRDFQVRVFCCNSVRASEELRDSSSWWFLLQAGERGTAGQYKNRLEEMQRAEARVGPFTWQSYDKLKTGIGWHLWDGVLFHYSSLFPFSLYVSL